MFFYLTLIFGNEVNTRKRHFSSQLVSDTPGCKRRITIKKTERTTFIVFASKIQLERKTTLKFSFNHIFFYPLEVEFVKAKSSCRCKLYKIQSNSFVKSLAKCFMCIIMRITKAKFDRNSRLAIHLLFQENKTLSPFFILNLI